jgi:aspartate kinase
MPIIVQKYGGSSVADVAKIGQVADKVAAAKRAGNDVVVVVSAMGKTTDELLLLARRVAIGATPDRDVVMPRRELDMLVSTGERVTMALLSIALDARGHQAISFTGSQSGILTNDRHFDARIIEVRPHRIEDELSRGRIVIVAGYQGMSYKREITTLGRGGSDTTAVALAAALGAERCEIYSDVDGVYSADPRVVPEAVHLPEIDFASLQEMAEAGAKVLNAQAVEWARRAKVTLHARKTSDPIHNGGPPRETVAVEAPSPEGASAAVNVIRAIVGCADVAELRVRGPLRRFAEVAASLELPLGDVSARADEARVSLSLLNLPDWPRKRGELEAALGDALTLETGRAVVSVVGHGVTTDPRSLPRFLASLEEASATPTSTLAGPLRIAATVDGSRLESAQRALHRAFVER